MLEQIRKHALEGESFAFETTLSGLVYAHRIPRWREQGYRVKLFFLRLPSPEMAIARVARRVLQGGHDVPETVIRRRFEAGLRNFEQESIGIWWMGGFCTIIREIEPKRCLWRRSREYEFSKAEIPDAKTSRS